MLASIVVELWGRDLAMVLVDRGLAAARARPFEAASSALALIVSLTAVLVASCSPETTPTQSPPSDAVRPEATVSAPRLTADEEASLSDPGSGTIWYIVSRELELCAPMQTMFDVRTPEDLAAKWQRDRGQRLEISYGVNNTLALIAGADTQMLAVSNMTMCESALNRLKQLHEGQGN